MSVKTVVQTGAKNECGNYREEPVSRREHMSQYGMSRLSLLKCSLHFVDESKSSYETVTRSMMMSLELITLIWPK